MKQRKIILIAILVVLLVALVVILVWQVHQEQVNPSRNQAIGVVEPEVISPNPPVRAIIKTLNNETTVWNRRYGSYKEYYISYPNNWSISHDNTIFLGLGYPNNWSPGFLPRGDTSKIFSMEKKSFYPPNKKGGVIELISYRLPLSVDKNISLTEAAKKVAGISNGEQVKIATYNALKTGQWPGLSTLNGAYCVFLYSDSSYVATEMLCIRYALYKDGSQKDHAEIKKAFENMAASLKLYPGSNPTQN